MREEATPFEDLQSLSEENACDLYAVYNFFYTHNDQ